MRVVLFSLSTPCSTRHPALGNDPRVGRFGDRGAERPAASGATPFGAPAPNGAAGVAGARARGVTQFRHRRQRAAISRPPGGGRGQHTHLARRRLHLGGLAGLVSGARTRSGSSGGRARSHSISPMEGAQAILSSSGRPLSRSLSLHSLTRPLGRPPAGRYLQSMKCGASRLLMRLLAYVPTAEFALSFSPNPPLARTQRARRHHSLSLSDDDATLSKKFMERVTFIATRNTRGSGINLASLPAY
jgi:hypothetical protein